MAARSRSRRSAVEAGLASAAVAEVEASLEVPADPRVAAFFDVDNTMMQGASIYHFARGLAARDFFTWRDLAAFGMKQVAFRLRGIEDPEHMEEAKQAALGFVEGHSVEEVVRLGEEIYDELMADRIWSGTRALAQLHLDAGQRVWLVTAAPAELASLVARRLGLTGALGTVSEIANGIYTGRLVGAPLHGPAKAEAILALAAQEGLELSQCSAYSDSANDLPMLTTVGHPVAVNPDAKLKRIARENGWDIRDFRTGRKAAKVGVPTAAGAGAIAGGIAVGLAMHRRSQRPVARARRLIKR
ncbi:MAG TPA: HAD family hydrolase [Mycobacteriales bacterium]|jgi:HAD superfamily hydrolase (TIGR01490 family)|nr:HAD family hydrolase [Mycobacteriales bacterium]